MLNKLQIIVSFIFIYTCIGCVTTIQSSNGNDKITKNIPQKTTEIELQKSSSDQHAMQVRRTDTNNQSNTVLENFPVNSSVNKTRQIIYIHTDLLGTPVVETDENGNILE